MPETVFQSGCGGDMPVDDTGKDRDRFKVKARNHHPTVKPLALMRYLCRLVTPPNGLILDPFMGSGTTLIAAEQEGFRAIGIEVSEEYVEIAKRRVASVEPQHRQAEAFV
jgi:site-specific DNA-methyltransferase (adenine-specific)